MKTASSEIRVVAVKAYGAGVSRQQIADILGYHLNSVSRWIREFEREKRLEARPRGHRVCLSAMYCAKTATIPPISENGIWIQVI